ncbi:class I SAM-dependent methyltransferase [Helcobacillus massiliensis]|uniref:class I SAM-dependent methyltransferase n=1 Tax=Helcobacillus massiliensis TaxID=521392 RepID=UPI00255341A2|nr:class I SAM-dependent methyltransferase [Helcobacillus massiliensis]MDK7741456.1 class I SAM-dependent methyltransferase [Helcobacillus massiliensis]WOO92422.1 class I SAM-dependent methyltransferase [Helcobacillus massiliensis]
MSALAPVLTPEGFALLNSLPAYDESRVLQLGEALRRDGHSAETVAAVMTQSRLRAKAHEKFGEFADQMLFTPDGLEQATRLPIAAHHAQRFRDAGIESVADLGCGIGGDTLAKAGLGLEVIGVEKDEETAAVATANLRLFPTARIELGDLTAFDPARVQGLWFDPARRAGRARLHDPEQALPPLSTILDFARRIPATAAKLAPAIDHAHLPTGSETQWISWRGQVLEAVLHLGPLAREGVARSALLFTGAGGSQVHRLDPDSVSPSPDSPHAADDPDLSADGVRDHLYEPDGAVIRAGLIGTLARRLDADLIDESIAYLTADERVDSPFAQGYAVEDVFDFSMKALQAHLRSHRIGTVEFKKRGTAVEPEELRRRLKPARFGDESATVILTRVAGKQSVIIAHPHRDVP